MRLLSACAAAVLGGFALAGASCADRLACVRELQRQVEAAGGYAEAAAQEVQGAFYAGGELGMVAKGFVAEGDMVLSVPVEAIVMPPTCEDGFDPDRDDAVLYLTRCLLKTSNPLFKQYLAALPEETANLYAYTEDELAEFQTTSLRDMINLKKDAMKEVYANMTDLQASFDELYAVYSKVVARSHTIPVKIETQPGVFDWKYMPALVPLVDMMNQGIQNTACYTPEKGDEFVCETLEEVEEGTELLARYGARQMDNIRALINYGMLDDDLWKTTPFSVPTPREIANMSDAKLEIAKAFHPHIAQLVKEPYITLTEMQVPMVLHSSSIILAMERLACVPDEFVESLEQEEHATLAQTISSCNASNWQHEGAAEVIPQACDCGYDALIRHFRTTLDSYPTTIEEDEAYLAQLQNKRTASVAADGSVETTSPGLSASDIRRINAVRWRMQEKRILRMFEEALIQGKAQQ